MDEADALVARLRAAGCVFAEEEAAVLLEAAGDDPEHLEQMVQRRAEGEPLETVVGWTEFAGLRIPSRAGVFVPRRRTELVAKLAIAALPPAGTAVDLCCGSGAIAAAMASARAGARVIAADIDPLAIELAATTLTPWGATAVTSDMDAGLPSDLFGKVDVVAACPPYVPSAAIATMAREARDFEPRLALDGGPDGTALQARVFDAASRLLRPGGVCIVETSDHLADATVAVAGGAGLSARVEKDDERGAVAVVAMRS